MLDGLGGGSTAGLADKEALLRSLALVEFKDDSERNEDEDLDDAKGTDRPPPVIVALVEGIESWRSGEGGADVRRAGKGKGKGTVLQPRRIGDEDVHDEVDGIEANPVEDVAGGIAIGTLACSENDHTNEVDGDKDEEALSSTPEVECLGNGQLQNTTDDVGEDTGRRDLGSGSEGGICVLCRVIEDGGLEGEGEEADPDPGRVR